MSKLPISLNIICKDEEKSLPNLLKITNKYVSETIIIDTGSTDNTIEIAKSMGAKVYKFKWIDDFSKARNYALKKSTQDYILWFDGHDEISDAFMEEISKIIDNKYEATYAKYNTHFNDSGNITTYTYRERLVKKTLNPIWKGIIHECLYFDKTDKIFTMKEAVYHRPIKKHSEHVKPNYLNLLEKNAILNKNEARSWYYLAREYYDTNNKIKCIDLFKKCFDLSNWNDEKFWCKIYIARANMYLKNYDAARQECINAINFDPKWPDGPFVMGEICYYEKKWEEAIYWFNKSRTIKEPNTIFIKDKTVYTYKASLEYLPLCYYYINDIEKAFIESKIAIDNCPNNKMAIQNFNYFKNKINEKLNNYKYNNCLCIYIDKEINDLYSIIFSFINENSNVFILDKTNKYEYIKNEFTNIEYEKTELNLQDGINYIINNIQYKYKYIIISYNDLYLDGDINIDSLSDECIKLSINNDFPILLKNNNYKYNNNIGFYKIEKPKIIETNNFGIKKQNNKSLAIYLPGSLGDIIMTLNFANELRKKYKYIDYYCDEQLFNIFKKFVSITKIVDNFFSLKYYNEKNYNKTWKCKGYPIAEGYPQKPMSKHILEYLSCQIDIPMSFDYFKLNKINYNIPFEKYITIQNKTGWSPYKEWNKWEDFINKFKSKYTDIKIVQIGGPKDPEIKNIDLRINNLDFFDMLMFQFNSIAHIGLDSVFNHTTNIQYNNKKTKAIILFGSTQSTASGYPHNTNISINLKCQPCFREYPTMTSSPIYPNICPNPKEQTLENPKHMCMELITTDMVINKFEEIMN